MKAYIWDRLYEFYFSTHPYLGFGAMYYITPRSQTSCHQSSSILWSLVVPTFYVNSQTILNNISSFSLFISSTIWLLPLTNKQNDPHKQPWWGGKNNKWRIPRNHIFMDLMVSRKRYRWGRLPKISQITWFLHVTFSLLKFFSKPSKGIYLENFLTGIWCAKNF